VIFLSRKAQILVIHNKKVAILLCDIHSTTGDSLLTGSGPKWFRTRHLLTPAFHFDILKPYVKVYCECVDVLLVSAKCATYVHVCSIFKGMYLPLFSCKFIS